MIKNGEKTVGQCTMRCDARRKNYQYNYSVVLALNRGSNNNAFSLFVAAQDG